MTPTSPRIRPRWRSLLRWTLVALLAVLTLEVVAGLAARRRLEQARERVASRGESLRYADFAPPDVADDENATGLLEAAVLVLEAGRPAPGEAALAAELDRRLRDIDHRRSPVTADDLAFFRRAVDAHQLALAVTDEALLRRRARVDADYATPFTLEPPNILPRLELAALLRARARLAIEDGHSAAAYRDAAALFRLAGLCEQEMPNMLYPLVAANIARQAARTVESLMEVAPPSGEEMTRILEEARRWDPRQSLRRAFAAERAAAFSILVDERTAAALAADVPLGQLLTSRAFRPWLVWNAAAYSDAMSENIDACSLPVHRWEPAIAERAAAIVRPGWAFLARKMLPPMIGPVETAAAKRGYACTRCDVLVAELDLMEIAFRLEDHRRETGAHPEALAALADLPEADPFSGGPYRYRRGESGVVYSVSGNGTDDGGTPPLPELTPWRALAEGDLVWRLPPASAGKTRGR